ncbi:MAG: hypothetical protein QOD99_657 [Chthoniobacter sp.]|jgi:hypothetical protein|nr:hypothetical protein [Chthoniobacter sp.]
MRRGRLVETLIFVAAFFAFGYFNQGGGWNQNARFAEVRAIAEQGTFNLDSFLVYQRTNSATLKRLPVTDGDLTRRGKTYRLSWLNEHGGLVPINGKTPAGATVSAALTEFSASGDVAFARGHFYPNKPPGSSFAAVPAYFLLQKIERVCGHDPDDWRLLVVNAWLVSAFSVGLVSALGCVLFFRCAKIFAAGNATIALVVTFAFAFGTLFFPFATLLFDHDLTSVFLLASFYWILSSDPQKRFPRLLILSGFAAGLAAITNYVAAVAVAILGVYLLAKSRGHSGLAHRLFAFLLGVLGPLLAICAYNQNCYGSPFALSNTFQNPVFTDSGPTFLGMFGVPRPDFAVALLVSPFRGLFYSAPILTMGVYGLFRMRKQFRAELWLFVAMFALFFLINISFFGWHGGFASGPRYLIPALPFLALPMVYGFARFPKTCAALASLSVVFQLALTAVDAESPVGVGSLAMVGDRPMWSYSPLMDYALPLFATGHAWPLLHALVEEQLTADALELDASGVGEEERARELAGRRAELLAAILRGSPSPFLLATFSSPVSVNPIGIYEGGYYRLFHSHSIATQWASFNVGEFLFPESQWSLAPLLIIEAALIAMAFRVSRLAQKT